MTCLNEIPFFKAGDTFDLPVQLFDTDSEQGIALTDDMQFSAQVNDKFGRLISVLDVTPYVDQNTHAGFMLLSFVGDTGHWPIGLAQTDIKLVQYGSIRHSQTIDFDIVRSITA